MIFFPKELLEQLSFAVPRSLLSLYRLGRFGQGDPVFGIQQLSGDLQFCALTNLTG